MLACLELVKEIRYNLSMMRVTIYELAILFGEI